jgi:hypothetical protein
MQRVVRQLQPKKGAVDVPLGKLPMLVRFRDINDRNSIEEVNPLDLAAAYGPGVRLLRATFELTNDSITPMPPNWPNWLVKETVETPSPVTISKKWEMRTGVVTLGCAVCLFKLEGY